MAAGLGANANGADLVQVGASPFLRRTRFGAKEHGADVFGCSSVQISWRRPEGPDLELVLRKGQIRC